MAWFHTVNVDRTYIYVRFNRFKAMAYNIRKPSVDKFLTCIEWKNNNLIFDNILYNVHTIHTNLFILLFIFLFFNRSTFSAHNLLYCYEHSCIVIFLRALDF